MTAGYWPECRPSEYHCAMTVLGPYLALSWSSETSPKYFVCWEIVWCKPGISVKLLTLLYWVSKLSVLPASFFWTCPEWNMGQGAKLTLFLSLKSFLFSGKTGSLLAWNTSCSLYLVTSFRYCSLIDFLGDFILWTKGLFVSGCSKRRSNKLRPFWLYPKYLKPGNSSKSLVLVAECFRDWLSSQARSWQSKNRKMFVKFPLFPSCPPEVASIIIYIFQTAFCIGGYCTCSDTLNFFLILPWFDSKESLLLIAFSQFFCIYRLWKRTYGIRLSTGEESFRVFRILQRTSSWHRCFF